MPVMIIDKHIATEQGRTVIVAVTEKSERGLTASLGGAGGLSSNHVCLISLNRARPAGLSIFSTYLLILLEPEHAPSSPYYLSSFL